MPYKDAKIYTDGSHFIAIPYRPKPTKKRKTLDEDAKITIKGEQEDVEEKINLKQRFEESYGESMSLKKNERQKFIINSLNPYFENTQSAKQFVDENIQRKRTNAIARKVRLMRKLRLQDWNYFCTFTYDSAKHTEESFREKLKTCLRHLSNRKGWKYIGVWERSPKKSRLHFHGIFSIPNNAMIGDIVAKEDYNIKSHKMQLIHINTHFETRFGRNDFESITFEPDLMKAVNYIMKYMEKSGEKLVYSRGISTYFVSDILDEDVLCFYGVENRKLILADNFTCINDGEIIGTVSRESISQLKKSN